MKISLLLETASKTLAPSKSEMQVLLEQWKALALQDEMNSEYPDALERAITILSNSSSVSEMLAKLKQIEKF